MKPEEKVFLGGVAVVLVVTIGYVTYNSIGGSEGARSSQIAFTSEPSEPQQAAGDESSSGSTDSTPQVVQREQSSQRTSIERVNEESDNDASTAGRGIIQDPVPVPLAERSGGEIALALRNLRVQTEGFQQRLVAQGQALRALQQQVNELEQGRNDYQEQLETMNRSYAALRNELSGQSLNEESSSATTELAAEHDGYQLTKLLEDQAWILTPEGRTYIVGEGDWFGNEYIINIDITNHMVITSAGELEL